MESKMKIYPSGAKYWLNMYGEYHRLDGPAIEWTNGTKEWYVNDQYHRLDGPAIERCNGNKYWYVDDCVHRINGPAVECEWADGTEDEEWGINLSISYNPIMDNA